MVSERQLRVPRTSYFVPRPTGWPQQCADTDRGTEGTSDRWMVAAPALLGPGCRSPYEVLQYAVLVVAHPGTLRISPASIRWIA